MDRRPVEMQSWYSDLKVQQLGLLGMLHEAYQIF